MKKNKYLALPYCYKAKKNFIDSNDRENKKRKLAFKPISFSRKIDVGKPPFLSIQKIYNVSEFRKLYLKGFFPFRMTKLATTEVGYWTTSLKRLPIYNIFPCFIEGLSDTSDLYQRLALAGLKSIIINWNNKDLLDWIPNYISPLQKCTRTFNTNTVSRTMIFLSYLIHSHPLSAQTLLPYFALIFREINYFFRHDYKPERIEELKLQKDIWDFLRDFEVCCHPNEWAAYHEIKKYLPIYESRIFCDVK